MTNQAESHFQSTLDTNSQDNASLSNDLRAFLSDPTIKTNLLNGNLDLSSYSTIINSELNTLENECIAAYRENSDIIKELRLDLEECDLILASLQEMLLGFSADLGGLSGDIKALQTESQSLGCKLVNRKNALNTFRGYLGRGIVSPNLCEAICNGHVNEMFVQCVMEIDRKWRFLKGSSTEYTLDKMPEDTPSGKELLQFVSKLRERAVVRIRSYFLQTMTQLRKPKTNIRMIQVNCLLKYVKLLEFILDANIDIFNEIRNAYVESMSKTLAALFRAYSAQLSVLDNVIATRKDIIAIDESTLKDIWARVNMSKRGDAFCLGDRYNVLESYGGVRPEGHSQGNHGGDTQQRIPSTSSSNGIISSNYHLTKPIQAHVAIANQQKYPYEVIFKSITTHLMDSVTNEYIFTRQFFQEHGVDMFDGIFGKTMNLILEQVENYLFNCYDCIGLLLMIKLTHIQRRVMKLRKINCMDDFFDSLESLLWYRLKTVMDKQIKSVRDGDATKLGMSGVDMINTSSHYISRRYAELTCSILLILNKGMEPKPSRASSHVTTTVKSTDTTSNKKTSLIAFNESTSSTLQPYNRGVAGDMLLTDLSTLQDETLNLLQRLSEKYNSNKNRIIFLINNLDQIISIFQERRVVGVELNRFIDLLSQQRELFVEEELLQSFSKLIAFVHQTEQYLNLSDANSSKAVVEGHKIDVNVQVVENLVREFAANWKQGIELINRNVLSYFSNFRNGMEILKQVLTQLLLYYTRFQDIIRKVWRSKTPSFCKDLVSTSVILAEIKKYALAI